MGRLTMIRYRVLLPIGLTAVVLGAAGDGLLGSTVLFLAGLAGAGLVLLIWAVSLYVEAGPEPREVSEVSHFRTTGDTP